MTTMPKPSAPEAEPIDARPRASGVFPRTGVLLGPRAGGVACSPDPTDVAFTVDDTIHRAHRVLVYSQTVFRTGHTAPPPCKRGNQPQ
jgi:acetyl-CoA carboxylase carboxyltransferase component